MLRFSAGADQQERGCIHGHDDAFSGKSSTVQFYVR
jgi:hypothetical protein